MVTRFMPVARARKDGSLVYGQRPGTRVAALAAAAAFVALAFLDPGATALGKVSWCLVASVLAGAAVSSDSWRFGGGTITRRFGFWPFMRSWSLPASRVVSLGLRQGAAGESPNGILSDRDRMEASVFGMGRGDWVALALVLDDGRMLVLGATRPARAGRLRQDGAAIAAALGLSLDGPARP